MDMRQMSRLLVGLVFLPLLSEAAGKCERLMRRLICGVTPVIRSI